MLAVVVLTSKCYGLHKILLQHWFLWQEKVKPKLASMDVNQYLQEREISPKKKWYDESKKTWNIAAPAILTVVSQFSFEFVTAAFVGHLGNVELAAVSEVQNVVGNLVYGAMLGMGSALETLCGQAVGASQFNMLGIYLQRSWIITVITALFLTPIYIFTSPILKTLHQDKHISALAGKYASQVIPQIFAYALNFPIQKFLQSQSKIWVMTVMSVVSLAIHVLLSWLLIIKFGQGLFGAAMAGNISWWLLVVAQLVYVTFGFFPDAWTGFSFLAFKSLARFVRLSLASAIMICFELWYFTAIILMVGGIKDSTNAVDAVSICMNLESWVMMVALGFNAAVSVRVSNELGAGKPEAAKFAVVVNAVTSAMIGLVCTAMIVASENQFPLIFSNKPDVIKETSKLGYLLGTTVFLNSIQPVLQGVAVGAGWQLKFSLVNICCYYVVSLPIAALLGFKFKLGVQGIWWAMLSGYLLQTITLSIIILQENWRKEALKSEDRVKEWSGIREINQNF